MFDSPLESSLKMKQLVSKILLLMLFFSGLFSNLKAGERRSPFTANLLGYGGVMVVPTAYMPGDGVITATFSRIPKLYAAKLQPYRTSSVYTMNAGIFSFMEGFVSLVRPDHFKGGTGDRTAGLRVNILRENEYRPALTFGMQDFFALDRLDLEPSSAQVFAALYMVASKSFKFHNRWTLVHMGYGADWLPAKTRQLNGLFGAFEVETVPDIYLLFENDAKRWNVGLRALLFTHFQAMAGWWGFNEFCFNVSASFNLNQL